MDTTDGSTEWSRTILVVLGVAGLVALAGCAGLVGGATDATSTGEPERTIEVSTGGEATGEPDRAALTVSVVATGEDPTEVREALAEDGDGLRTALIDWGIDEGDIRTDRYVIRETRESRTEEGVEAYRGEHRYEIGIDDVDAVGEVIDVAVDAGADSVHRIRFGLSDEREAALRERALVDAMGNAEADATVLATNADLTIVGVSSVSTANTRVTPYTTRVTDDVTETDAANVATGIETGDVSVSAQVRVVYEAERN